MSGKDSKLFLGKFIKKEWANVLKLVLTMCCDYIFTFHFFLSSLFQKIFTDSSIICQNML